VRARLAALEDELAAVNERIEQHSQHLGGVQRGLSDNFEQRAGAFREAAELEGCLAETRRLAEEWARLSLGAKLLEDEIERYRQDNQGPILARASQLYARLTLGAFRELRADFRGDDDFLRCLRDNGEEVEVAGLSEGTRDQLYLALRLATLERFAARSEPMPLVLDDVCINFDDARAQAALEVLFEVSERFQVLFFTHNPHLVELARAAAPAGRLAVHRLREGARQLELTARASAGSSGR
jgi:uncharacterized protein YhaN